MSCTEGSFQILYLLSPNRANAQLSSGPVTAEGKAVSCKNNFRHGFTGSFQVLTWENEAEFNTLHASLVTQHQPSLPFEIELVNKMAQHYWLARRAQLLQDLCFDSETATLYSGKELALYLRYQTTHDRAFHKCSDELRKLRNEKRKAELGFESQKLKQDIEARKQSVEKRNQELHHIDLMLAHAKVDHQKTLTKIAQDPIIFAKLAEQQRNRAQKAA